MTAPRMITAGRKLAGRRTVCVIASVLLLTVTAVLVATGRLTTESLAAAANHLPLPIRELAFGHDGVRLLDHVAHHH